MSIKKYLKTIGISVLIILIGALFISVLSYFSIFNKVIIGILKFIILISSFFYSGFSFGKIASKMGYIEGIKAGLILTIIMVIYNIILKNQFGFKTIIFYMILLFISTLGGMIGISKNKNTK